MQYNCVSDIHIRNFKCHQDFREEFKGLTIMTGGNASGKSSVIQAILMLAKAYQEADKSRIAANNVFCNNLGLPESLLSEEHNSDDISISLKISGHINNAVLRMKDTDSLFLTLENQDEILADREEPGSLAHIPFYYLNAERQGPRIASPISEMPELFVGVNGENTSYVISKMDLLERTDRSLILPSILKSSALTRFSANCEAWLDTIIPDTKLNVKTDMEMNLSVIRFQNEGGFYLPTATGFGITYVLPIIVQALAASMQSNAILIVENPEAHLHPYSQSAIGKFLALAASSGVQVIVETHSEHVINGCRLQLCKRKMTDIMKVLFFQKIKGVSNCKSILLNEYGEMEEWPEGFFDQTQKDLRELLELRGCGK